jgi:hypothetical protein
MEIQQDFRDLLELFNSNKVEYIIILINVATQVEDVEEKLKYVPPQTKGSVVPSGSVVAGQTIYVPIYSYIYITLN